MLFPKLFFFDFLYLARKLGSKDEVVERLVIGSDDLFFCPLPFFHTFFDEYDVVSDVHNRIHIVGVDNRRHIEFDGDAVNQVIDD